MSIRDQENSFQKTEDDIKALQSVGQIIAEVLKQLDDERCMLNPQFLLYRLIFILPYSVIVKASSGPRYVVGCRSKIDKSKLLMGTRVTLDMTTLTIMRILPREVDPLVYNMSLEDPGSISFAGIGGLSEQIREIREVCALYSLIQIVLIYYRLLNCRL